MFINHKKTNKYTNLQQDKAKVEQMLQRLETRKQEKKEKLFEEKDFLKLQKKNEDIVVKRM